MRHLFSHAPGGALPGLLRAASLFSLLLFVLELALASPPLASAHTKGKKPMD
jgi:hypothetical protein